MTLNVALKTTASKTVPSMLVDFKRTEQHKLNRLSDGYNVEGFGSDAVCCFAASSIFRWASSISLA